MADTVLHLERYTPAAKGFLVAAQLLADKSHHAEVTPVHFLLCVLEADQNKKGVRGIHDVFRRAGSDPTAILSACRGELAKLANTSKELAYLAPHLVELLGRAERKADAAQHTVIDSRYLLLAFSEDAGSAVTELLKREGLDPKRLADHLDAMEEAEERADEKLLDPTRYTEDAFARLRAAETMATKLRHSHASPLHLFIELLEWDHGVHDAFRRAGADPIAALERARTFLTTITPSMVDDERAAISVRLIGLLRKAEAEALSDKADKTGVEHMLHAFARELPNPPAEILWSAGVRPGSFRTERVEEPLTPIDVAERARQEAAQFALAVKESDDITLDYGPESLGWLSEQIDLHRLTWPTTLDPRAFENLKEVMGYYVGECVVERLRGRWIERDVPVVEVVNTRGEPQFALPFQAVVSQLAGDGRDSVLTFFLRIAAATGR